MENLQERLAGIDYSDLTGENFTKYQDLMLELAPEGDSKFKPASPSLDFDEFKAGPTFGNDNATLNGVVIVDPTPIRTIKIPAYDARIFNQQIVNARVNVGTFLLIKK